MLPIEELKNLLPVLKEKEQQGLILPSFAKAQDLVRWHENGRPLTEQQLLFVGRLILRAKCKHRDVKVSVSAETVDTDSIVRRVLEKVGSEKVDLDAVLAAVLPKLDGAFASKMVETVMKALEARVPRRVEIVVTKVPGRLRVRWRLHVRYPHRTGRSRADRGRL